MSQSYLSSAFNMLNDAAHNMAPSMFKEEGIPIPPPLPTKEDLNKHYLARDRTIENATGVLRSAAKFVREVATDLTASLPSAADLLLATRLDENGIPIPPPLPTKEDMHRHYLTRNIPIPPPMPTADDLHKHYLIPLAPAQPTAEDLHRHYLSRDKTIENVQASVRSAATTVSEIASDLTRSLWTSAPAAKISSQEHIPQPPPLPTAEDMHKHYLIPLAPAQPTAEDLHRHYLSRDKTIENVQNSARSTLNMLAEVVVDVKDYVLQTPISAYPADIKEALLPTPVDANGIPIPPPLPSTEAMHKHYLIPVPPALPTQEQMHRHYLSRDRTVENIQTSVASAATYVSEVATDLTKAASSSVRSVPAVAAEAGNAAASRVSAAKDTLSSAAEKVSEVVVETAQKLKEKALPSASKGAVYARGDSVSESPILRKNVPAGGRRIVARQNYEGFKPLLQ